jgi:F0F1-type ATP synthase assembly protein I
MPRGRPTLHDLAQYAALAQVGLEMVAPIAVGAALDYWLNWMPWATVCGAVLGLVGGMVHLVAILNRRADGPARRQRDET